MTYPGLHPGARPVVAACFRQTRWRLAYVRQQEPRRAGQQGVRREVAAASANTTTPLGSDG